MLNITSTSGIVGRLAAVSGVSSGAEPAPHLNVTVDPDPMNEFLHLSAMLHGAFPNLFFLGQGIPAKAKSPPDSLVEHMLLQADGRFAHSPNFLYALFNIMQRHAAW